MYLGLIRRTAYLGAISVVLTLGNGLLFANSATAEWTGGIEGGAVVRNGVTSNRLRLLLRNDSRPLSHYLYADWLRSDNDDSYEAGYRPRFWFSDQLYSFGELTFRVDKTLNIDRETTESIGIGYQLLNNDTQSAFVEAGAGARQTVFSNPLLDDESQPFGLARAGYTQELFDIARMELDGSVIAAETSTESNAEIGLAVRVGASAVKVSYRVIRRDIDGQDPITDDTSFVSLNYAFQ